MSVRACKAAEELARQRRSLQGSGGAYKAAEEKLIADKKAANEERIAEMSEVSTAMMDQMQAITAEMEENHTKAVVLRILFVGFRPHGMVNF